MVILHDLCHLKVPCLNTTVVCVTNFLGFRHCTTELLLGYLMAIFQLHELCASTEVKIMMWRAIGKCVKRLFQHSVCTDREQHD